MRSVGKIEGSEDEGGSRKRRGDVCETVGNQLDMLGVVFILRRTIAVWRGTKDYRGRLRRMAQWEALGTRCCGLVVGATGEKVYRIVKL